MSAPAIVTTAGSASANSFVSLAEASTYFSARLNSSAWTDATADEKAVALLQAARRLEDEDYAGTIEDDDQALSWPRNSCYDRNGVYLDPDDGVPQLVKDAQCELALALLTAGEEDLLADTGLDGFENVVIGPISVTPRQGVRPGNLPVIVRRILEPVLVTTSNSIRLVRG